MTDIQLPELRIAGRYRGDGSDRCPGCDRSQWLIGRITAECVFCATAMPLAEVAPAKAPRILERGSGGGKISRTLAA